MKKLFVYGTLMNDEVLSLLLGRNFSKTKAILPGFQCFKVKGQNYPAIIESEKSYVDGEILYDVNTEEFDLLDAYEGETYKRISVTVLTEESIEHACEVYVLKSDYCDMLSDKSWSNAEFRNKHLASFLNYLAND